MSMIHWSKLIVVVVLLSLTACHRSAKTEQIDNQENTKDILSICVQTDTIYQVKAFDWQNKHVFVVPSFWDKDTLSTFCNEEALLEQESNRLLADTNTRLMYSQLPVLFIEMEESDREHIYKDRSVSPSASIALFSADGTNEYEGPITIKTRGNTSWREPEKNHSPSNCPNQPNYHTWKKGNLIRWYLIPWTTHSSATPLRSNWPRVWEYLPPILYS